MMELRDIFDSWAESTQKKYSDKQWLLSKWEMAEGIEWPPEKIAVMVDSIRGGLSLESGDLIIDLGCGGGWIGGRLKPFVRRVCGLDIALHMLDHARETIGPGALVCGSIGNLPFKDQTFDKVLSYYVFMNFREDAFVEAGIREMMRVLKKDGRALIGQLPDERGSSDYDRQKADYLEYCAKRFPVGKNTRDCCAPPIKLFDRGRLCAFLEKERIRYEIQDSFNPFYRPGEPPLIDWRFDVILHKD